jgi:hypothetical protein
MARYRTFFFYCRQISSLPMRRIAQERPDLSNSGTTNLGKEAVAQHVREIVSRPLVTHCEHTRIRVQYVL